MSLSETEIDQLARAARLHLAQGELHEAAERAAEAIRLDGKAVLAYLLRAEAHRKLRKPERALADLAVAIRLDPQRPDPYVIRAEILKRRNVFDQAIADATHALTLDPRNAAAYSIRAQCRHAIGDREGATEDVQEMLLIDPTRPVPDLEVRAPSGGAPEADETDEERSRKRAGHPDPASRGDLFADGKPVDQTYRSRPAIVSDKEAPEALGVASGYKPEVMARPLPRTRPQRRPARGASPLAVLFVGGLCVLGGGYLMSRLGGGQQQPAGSAESGGTPPTAPDAGSWPYLNEAPGQGAGPAILIADAELVAGGPEPTYLVTLPRIDLHDQNGWWSDRGELVLGGLSGNPVARKPLMFEGEHSEHGIYLHARPSGEAAMTYRLGKRFESFQSDVLIPDMFPHQTEPRTPLVFKVVGDGRTIWQSRPLGRKGEHQPCSVDVTGIDELSLRVDCPGPENWGLAAWVEPRLSVSASGVDHGVGSGIAPFPPGIQDRTTASLDGPVDLLRLADPRKAITGAWSRTGNGLAVRTDGSRPAVLPIPYATPDEYDLEVQAEASEGGLFMIGLVHRDAQFAACLSLSEGKYWLQEFVGQPMQDNESTRRGPAFRDEDGLTIRCSVRADGLTILCDGQHLIDWKGDYSKFTDRSLAMVEIADRRSLFLASWVDRRITAFRLIPVASREGSVPGSAVLRDRISPVGKWAQMRPGADVATQVRTFTEDNRLILFMADSMRTVEGTWRQEGDRVYFSHPSTDGKEPPTVDKWFTIRKRDGESMTILMMGQREYVWHRVGIGEEAGEVRTYEGHTGVILGVTFSPDGKWIASAGGTTVRLWDASADHSGQAHITLATREPEPKGFIAVAFSPDGKTLAASKFDGSIALWDVTTSPPKLLRVLSKHGDPVIALAFSPDGKTLVTGGRNEGLLCFWDMEQPSDTPRTTIPGESNGAWSLAFSPDGTTLAEGVSFPPQGGTPIPGRVWLWDVGRRPYVRRAVIEEARKVPRSLAFSPDGSRLAFGDGDVARVIDARTGRPLGGFEGHTSFVVTVAFTPDGRRAISGGYDKAVRIWDATTMEQVHRFDGHDGYVEQVAVSPDGRLAASVGHDRSVRIWRLPVPPDAGATPGNR